jgi:uridylate kinase
MFKKTIVISLGGSLVVPDQINEKFLIDFRHLIISYIRRGFRFILIVGGGKTARRYQAAGVHVAGISPDDLDWLGIHATRLNGHLMRTIFRQYAYPIIITNKKKINTKTRKQVIVGAGFEPGSSTDLRAVQLARAYGADTVLNLSNIDWVYTKDPSKYKTAKPIKSIDWKSFRKIVGNKWNPGANVPFDPIAAKLAQQLEMRVVIARGTDLANLRLILLGQKARGTIVG